MNLQAPKQLERLIRSRLERLREREKRVAKHLAERTHISRNVEQDISARSTFDRVRSDAIDE
jgi:hypothetical protein